MIGLFITEGEVWTSNLLTSGDLKNVSRTTADILSTFHHSVLIAHFQKQLSALSETKHSQTGWGCFLLRWKSWFAGYLSDGSLHLISATMHSCRTITNYWTRSDILPLDTRCLSSTLTLCYRTTRLLPPASSLPSGSYLSPRPDRSSNNVIAQFRYMFSPLLYSLINDLVRRRHSWLHHAPIYWYSPHPPSDGRRCCYRRILP